MLLNVLTLLSHGRRSSYDELSGPRWPGRGDAQMRKKQNQAEVCSVPSALSSAAKCFRA